LPQAEDTGETKDTCCHGCAGLHKASCKESTGGITNHPFDRYLCLFNRVPVPKSFKEYIKSMRHTICLNEPQVLKDRDEKFNIRFVKYFTADGNF